MQNQPLATVLEVAFQRATTEEQLAFLFDLAAKLDHLETCFELEAADR